jgi:hypothetical protein
MLISALVRAQWCSPWLEKAHPDPHGEQLRKIAFVLEAIALKAREFGEGCRCGVFWDYVSLPQGRPDGVDDRSDEHKARFKLALKGINTWYGNPKTQVLLVTTPLPTGASYSNVQPYLGRGWCFAEKLMSAMVKDDTALIDLSGLDGTKKTLRSLREKGKARRQPPIAPDAFHRELKAGVEDGSIKFTNRGDVDVVAGIYERAFDDEMTAVTALYYIGLGWGDDEMATLSAAFSYAHAKGALAQLEKLDLNRSQIGDAGVTALAKACAKGALACLTLLNLRNNKIGDAGVEALAKACVSGPRWHRPWRGR